MDPTQTLQGFSRGLYSNWLWHRPLGVVVDAGEGLQLRIDSVLRPTHLLITHDHVDHVLGLPGFLAARRFGLGDPEKPLTVLYPRGAGAIEDLRALVARLWPGEKLPVSWTAVAPGFEAPLDRKRLLHAFAADHPSTQNALSWRVLETRRRLRPEHASLPQAEIQRLARAGRRDELTEEHRHVLFAHTGDSMPLDPALFTGADLLVHDATFLDAADRQAPIHATTEEALAVAREAAVKNLVLHHLSVRYDRTESMPRLRAQLRVSGFAGDCWLLDDAHLNPVHPT